MAAEEISEHEGHARGLERLVFFTDAVTAIALTLLILPLVDAASEAAGSAQNGSLTPAAFLADHGWTAFAFLLTFAVIARLWVSHHRIFQRVRYGSGRVMFWSLAWILTIVVLPFFTEMVASFAPERLVVGLYMGTMAVSSLCLLILGAVTTTESRRERSVALSADERLRTSATITGIFIAAAILGTAVILINYWALFMLFLQGPITSLWARLSPPAASDATDQAATP